MLLKKIQIGKLTLDSNIFVAPLAGYTSLPARTIYREQNPAILYAEMVSAMGLKYSYNKSVSLIDTNEEDRPLGVQLFGPDVDSILEAFNKIKDNQFDIIDLNCGCSIKKIIKSNAGASLLKKPENIYNIIKALKDATDKPVTLKIRSGWDKESINFIEILEAAEKGGADLITFHPRTKSMTFKGRADWSQIKEMKNKSRIPVIGNGDVFTGDDAVSMMNETGCDGVMIARGIIENPFLIEEVRSAFEGKEYIPPDLEKRINTMYKHLDNMVNYFGELSGILEFRKFARGYLKGLRSVSDLRKKLNDIKDVKAFKEVVDKYYKSLSCSE